MSHRTRWTWGTAAATVAVLAGVLSVSAKRPAAAADDQSDSRIQIGFKAAPVPLNLAGKNRGLVGLGSYLVNVSGDCNGCHSGPSGEYVQGGDPFMGEQKQVNQAAYLSGGTPRFGPFFIPRNLTPDKTGLPEGGASYEEFESIMRTGIDPDQAHPQFGPYLQVMPWPKFQNMTDHELRAIYEYLSAIPCLEGDPGLPDPRPIGMRCQ
jgi:cytochrome c1